jgi:hypothetical protein
LNPVENIWQFLRQNHLNNRLFESYTDIADACCAAWNALIADPKRITQLPHEIGRRSFPNAVGIRLSRAAESSTHASPRLWLQACE